MADGKRGEATGEEDELVELDERDLDELDACQARAAHSKGMGS